MSLEKGLGAWGEEERGSLSHEKAKRWWIRLVRNAWRVEGGEGLANQAEAASKKKKKRGGCCC